MGGSCPAAFIPAYPNLTGKAAVMKQSIDRILTMPAFQALHYPNFRWFWLSNACHAIGWGMLLLTLSSLARDLTTNGFDPLMVGTLTVSTVSELFSLAFYYSIPYFAVVLLGGIIADRIDRRALLLVTRSGVTIVILVVATLTLLELVAVWHIYAAAFLLGIFHAVIRPARLAIVVNLVEREGIMNAVALNAVMNIVGPLVGAAVASGVIDLLGIGTSLYLNAFCYLLSASLILLMRGMEQSRPANALRGWRAGLDYFRKTPGVFTIIGIGFVFYFFGMKYIQVMSPFAWEVFGNGVEEFGYQKIGLLTLAAGVGSLLVNIVLVALGNARGKNWLMLGFILTFAISLFLFAWSEWYWLSWSLLLVVGVGSGGYISLGTTILQLTVQPELQGRVMSLWEVSAKFAYIGTLPMYLMAERISWPAALAGGAALCLACTLVMGVWRPTLRRLRI